MVIELVVMNLKLKGGFIRHESDQLNVDRRNLRQVHENSLLFELEPIIPKEEREWVVPHRTLGLLPFVLFDVHIGLLLRCLAHSSMVFEKKLF